MERTLEQMEEMAAIMTLAGPEVLAIAAPTDPTTQDDVMILVQRAPKAVGPLAAALAEAEVPFDLIGAPDFSSPMSWRVDLPALSTETLHAWKSVMPEGLSQETPPAFQIPSTSPLTVDRKSTLPTAKRLALELGSPLGSVTNLVDPETHFGKLGG